MVHFAGISDEKLIKQLYIYICNILGLSSKILKVKLPISDMPIVSDMRE